MKQAFIKDLDNKAIGDQISRLCFMDNVEPPNAPLDVVSLLRTKFGKWEASLIKHAFDTYLLGDIEGVKIYKKATVKNLADILSAYVERHRHRLKKYEPPLLESPYVPKDPKLLLSNGVDMTFELFMNAYEGKYTKRHLSIYHMHLIWNDLIKHGAVTHDGLPEAEVLDMQDWLDDYEQRKQKEIIADTDKNKKRYYQQLFAKVEKSFADKKPDRSGASYLAVYYMKYGKPNV